MFWLIDNIFICFLYCGILCPILLGSIITTTNYELIAVIILFILLFQIILSFGLTAEKEKQLFKFHKKILGMH